MLAMSPSKDLHYDKAETVVRTELAFYKHTHRPEVVANPSLFKLFRISHEERLSNYMILLLGQILELSGNFLSVLSAVCVV